MSRIRAAATAIGRALGGIVAPLLPEPGTTEASVYFGLILIAAAFLAANDVPKALGVPGVVITLLGCAPAIVGIRKRGS